MIKWVFPFCCLLLFSACRHGGDVETVSDGLSADGTIDGLDSLLSLRIDALVAHTPRINPSLVGIAVYDLTRHCFVYGHRQLSPMTPASCMKLLTAVCAMKRLGLKHRYDNKMYLCGNVIQGRLQGYLLLAMDDDPLTDSFADFVSALRQCGIEQIEGDIHFDLQRRDTLKPHPTVSPWDMPYRSLPLLMRGERAVMQAFLRALEAGGIQFNRNVHYGHNGLERLNPDLSPRQYAQALRDAQCGAHLVYWQSHSLLQVLDPMLIWSSNIKAEALRHHTDHYPGRMVDEPQPDGHTVQTFIQDEMSDVSPNGLVINDGSGLSSENRLTADFLMRLLIYAYHEEEIRHVLMDEALPATGSSMRQGTLTGRMDNLQGQVFAKTGTLTSSGVSSLAGFVRSFCGRLYAFAIINEDTPVAEGRLFQDAICSTLAASPSEERP